MPAAGLILGAASLGFCREIVKLASRKDLNGYVVAAIWYVIAVLALAATRENPIAVWAWLILGVFFVDASVTLLRRLQRGERVYEAHRGHAYQWLARRWGSHSKVTCAVLIVNVVWLLACAVFATGRPSLAAATVIFAFAPLVLVAIATSGRREANDRSYH